MFIKRNFMDRMNYPELFIDFIFKMIYNNRVLLYGPVAQLVDPPADGL